ncbi:GNAT family N-acetyltransferase [Pendulispora rubella]|uniref:GNAT family N-acetyltransferase n=1 Tax=Pendulispora rubella TaxID=2741070 RepID=A0ABZ2LGQ7_9BACT
MPNRAAASDFCIPNGIRLVDGLDERAVPETLALLEGTYWNEGVSRDAVARSHLGSTVWVGAFEDAGALVGSARVLSDGAKIAWIYDVIVRPDWRGQGVAQALMAFLLAHPAVRDVRRVRLNTRDAQRLYAKFGFRDSPPPLGPEMVLERDITGT